MNHDDILSILSKIDDGSLTKDEAAELLAQKGFEDHGDFKIDTGRKERTGFDEIIYGKSKTAEQIRLIAQSYMDKGLNFVCTGLDDNKISSLEKIFSGFNFNKTAGIMKFISNPAQRLHRSVAVITAGTSDLRVAHEAAEILDFCGADAKIFADVGVAGIHRFFHFKNDIDKCDVIIVIAGMEGALASVAGGIFGQPIIAVPTSTGYGTALNGFTALFSMLTSCASGITVVNIDNGFGAAMAAMRILKQLGGNNGAKTGH